MIISTKGRYALRALIDLAEHEGEGFVPLKDVAERQGISQKYIESIMALLSKNNFVDGLRGKGGGYRLNRAPAEYTMGEILRLTEGSLAPVACLEHGSSPCARAAECKTLPVWSKLNVLISDYLDSVTLEDVVNPQLRQE